MPKANEVAAELRKLADALDRIGECEVSAPNVYFSYCFEGSAAKDDFLALAKILPRPLTKEYPAGDTMDLVYKTNAIRVRTYIERSKVCTLIEPSRKAVYRCEPLLSPEEEDALTQV